VSQKLREEFGRANSGDARIVKAQIINDQVEPVVTKDKSGSFEDDLSQVASLLEAENPTYLLVRQDQDMEGGQRWILMCYVPDRAKVKEKMTYASTRANLKQQLGSNNFVEEIFGTVPTDFSAEGWRAHKAHKALEAPLTDAEQYKQRELEHGEIYSGGQSSYVHGVAFPVQSAVTDAIKGLAAKSNENYVRVAIDCDKEVVTLDHKGHVSDIAGLASQMPIQEPRFHFFRWDHDHEGAQVSSVVYVFSCPDGSHNTKSAPVRMRMLYSSSKANVAEIVRGVGAEINAKLEVNAPEDITEDQIRLLLHPPAAEDKKQFARPSRPGKGGARLIRGKQ